MDEELKNFIRKCIRESIFEIFEAAPLPLLRQREGRIEPVLDRLDSTVSRLGELALKWEKWGGTACNYNVGEITAIKKLAESIDKKT